MRIQNLRFRAGGLQEGAPLESSPGSITVFIGPNNGGKSLAIREIHQSITNGSGANNSLIFDKIDLSVLREEIEEKRSALRLRKKENDDLNSAISIYGRRGARTSIYESSLTHLINSAFETSDSSSIAPLLMAPFAINLDGQNRLSLVNPVGSQRLQDEPNSTLAALFLNDGLRHRLSSIVHAAFNYHLVVDLTAMSTLNYALSVDAPVSVDFERALNEAAVQFYGRALPVNLASDGTKAFIGIMAEALAGNPEILFIDEPEAFLHQGLQYIIGREISGSIASDKQVFIATHSPDFLMGCLSSGAEINVIRLTYHAGIATARILSAERLKQIVNDPLLRSIGVLSALFYQSVIIVEGGSDSAFYDEINNRIEKFSNGSIRHAIFLNAHNKQSAAEISLPLRELGVPAALILDIDWIKEDGQVARKYFRGAGLPVGLFDGKIIERRQIRAFLDAAHNDYKRQGGVNLLKSADLDAATEFFDTMDRYGLFTVRSGEVESWLSSTNVARNKASWLGDVFRAMGSTPTDPNYILPDSDDVWAFLRKIARWTSDTRRAGIP
jgi:ABC-type Mn2+/Zn2+ transport system ATPase subunit